MLKEDFNFDLPKELIALYPSNERSQCRMLVLDGNSGATQDTTFIHLKDYLQAGDLLVFNDTKVIAARLYGSKQSGGKVELLIERVLSKNQALAHIKASKAPKADTLLFIDGGYTLKVLGREEALFLVELKDDISFFDMLDNVGHIPLPPYIDREDEPLDKDRYQTVYSKNLGAVAAPTAGLHFDKEQLQALQQQGIQCAFVTLHVGAGTFQPVRSSDITQHHMHKEYVQLSQQVADLVIATRKRGNKVVAVGTTAVRSLESAAKYAKEHKLGDICEFYADTSIFIYPGYKYEVVDALITNFHLPESTLIMLVSAFAGYKNTMQAYKHAIDAGYKFFSYGDCMFINKRTAATLDLPPSAKLEENN